MPAKPTRSWMFVPGNKERFLAKAADSDVDCVFLDLEDGVLPELVGVTGYPPGEFQDKVDWMVRHGFLNEAPAYKDVVRRTRDY